MQPIGLVQLRFNLLVVGALKMLLSYYLIKVLIAQLLTIRFLQSPMKTNRYQNGTVGVSTASTML